jgi:hypothetical protein
MTKTIPQRYDSKDWKLYAVGCPPLDQLWYMTSISRARTIASSMSCIIPSPYSVTIHEVGTELPHPQTQPPEPVILDRTTQTRWRRPSPYDGQKSMLLLDTYDAHGEQYTPLQKQRSYRTLQQYIAPEYWALLSPLAQFRVAPRTDLTPGRAFKAAMKAAQA